jgi:hypothetical protein
MCVRRKIEAPGGQERTRELSNQNSIHDLHQASLDLFVVDISSLTHVQVESVDVILGRVTVRDNSNYEPISTYRSSNLETVNAERIIAVLFHPFFMSSHSA